MTNYFKIVRKYSGRRRFELKKRLRGEENLLARMISLARGGQWA